MTTNTYPVTLIPKATVSVGTEEQGLDILVSGWSEPAHTLTSIAPTENLEDGSIIHDHIISLPVKLTLKGYVSDIVLGSDRPGVVWDKVRELHRNEELLNVYTEWAYYPNMYIQTAETRQTGRGMIFTLEMQQINKVAFNTSIAVKPPALDRGIVEAVPVSFYYDEDKETVTVFNPDPQDNTKLTAVPLSKEQSLIFLKNAAKNQNKLK